MWITSPPGVDFVTYLSQQVAACDVFLVVMAPGWLDVRDDTGQRRIDDPADFVAIEIAAALARGDKIRVIPVLLDGTTMPKADELPDALKPLARRNAVEVRNAQFGRDAEVLIGKIKEALKAALQADRHAPKRWPKVVGLVGLLALIALQAWDARNRSSRELVETAGLQKEAAAAKKKDGELVVANRAAAERKRIADGIAAEKATAEAKRTADAATAKKAEDKKAEDKKADDERKARAEADAKALADAKAALEKATASKAEAARRAEEKLEPEFAELVATGTANQLAGFALLNPSFAARAEPVVARKRLAEEARRTPQPGQVFRDCNDGCPEMVVVPGGTFTMGANDYDDEKPPHPVTIPKPYAVGKYTVTFAEWDACVAAGGCKSKPPDEGWGRDRRPVINVSWDDVTNEYLPWLNKKTGHTYRLLSEAEWEHAARGGTKTRYSFGESNFALGDYAWFNRNAGGKTHPVGEKKPNPFGHYDMHGNVWQWTQDCWHDSYKGSPPGDGTAWTTSCSDSNRRVLRGGSWVNDPQLLRSADRSRDYRRQAELQLRLPCREDAYPLVLYLFTAWVQGVALVAADSDAMYSHPPALPFRAMLL